MTLPSPYAFGEAAGIDPREIAASVLAPAVEALDAELIVLSEPFLARSPDADVAALGDALAQLPARGTLVLQLTFGDASSLLERLVDLPVDGIGVDFYLTPLDAVPEGFPKLLLAGVVDARSSEVEDPGAHRQLRGAAGRADVRRARARAERRSPVRGRADREAEARRARRGQGAGGMSVRFLTHEVGSLAKPPWLVKTSAGRPLGDGDVDHARSWGERLSVPGHEELVALLEQRPGEEAKDDIARWSSRYALRLQEQAGLDVVWDGEQLRTEMYAWAIAHSKGFEPRGTVRSFDNKYYSKSAVTGPVGLREPYHNAELEYLQSVAQAKLKIPITGAYTLAVWSYDEHYGSAAERLGAGSPRAAEIAARREFALDIARNIIRPNLEALIELGAEWIQIDEPGASTEPDELEVFVESFNASVEGLDCYFSTHLCFSDYDLFFPAIEGMSGCRQYCVGFANYDERELGTSAAERPGYRVIERFRDLPYEPALGIGVLDIHTDFVEPPELVRDRILHAVDVFGGPERIHVTPDCGLRTRSWEVAYEKLVNMVEGTRLAEAEP